MRWSIMPIKKITIKTLTKPRPALKSNQWKTKSKTIKPRQAWGFLVEKGGRLMLWGKLQGGRGRGIILSNPTSNSVTIVLFWIAGNQLGSSHLSKEEDQDEEQQVSKTSWKPAWHRAGKSWQTERRWTWRSARCSEPAPPRLPRSLRPGRPPPPGQRLPRLLQLVQGGRCVLHVHRQLLQLPLLPQMCQGPAHRDEHGDERCDEVGLSWTNCEKCISQKQKVSNLRKMLMST